MIILTSSHVLCYTQGSKLALTTKPTVETVDLMEDDGDQVHHHSTMHIVIRAYCNKTCYAFTTSLVFLPPPNAGGDSPCPGFGPRGWDG
jgi:hypothetical protein